MGGSEAEYPAKITQTEDGGFIMAGETSSNNYDVSGNHSAPNGYDSDVWVVKLSCEGELLWQKCYGGWGDERLYICRTVFKKDDYNYVLAAWTDFVTDDVTCEIHQTYIQDAWLFEIDIEDTTNIIDALATKNKIMVYPNPARDYVVFELVSQSLDFKSLENKGEIIIKNVFGPEVSKTSNKSETTIWDTREIKSGIYFYSTFINDEIISGKIIIE